MAYAMGLIETLTARDGTIRTGTSTYRIDPEYDTTSYVGHFDLANVRLQKHWISVDRC